MKNNLQQKHTSGVEIWLVRHGQTTANAEGRLSGWHDVDLTPKGVEQAEALKPRLEAVHFDAIYSSDLRRAVRTARLAYGEPKQDKRLRETNFGDFDGKLIADLDPNWVKDLYVFKDFAAPNGESKNETKDRAVEFMNELENGRYVVVCHGGLIRTLTIALGEDRFIDNGEVLIVDWTKQKILDP